MSLRRRRFGIGRIPAVSSGEVTPEVLLNAVRSGDLEQVESILKENPDLNKSKDRQYRATLLHSASSFADAKIVKYLLENGAAVDAQDRRGCTALVWAAAWGREAAVELLLAHEAAIDLADDLGRTPLHWAVHRGHAGMVELLCARGADTNARTNQGATHLMCAAAGGFVRIAEMLQTHGVNANTRDNGGFNALYYAASGGHLDVAKLLLKQGADVNSRSNDGWTALHTAAFRGRLEVVKWLMENGAEVDATNSRSQTPLFWAATSIGSADLEEPPRMNISETEEPEVGKKEAATFIDKEGAVKCLLARGASVNASDESGMTPLYCAAYAGALEVTTLLLAGDTNVNARNKEGWTALCIAAKQGHGKVVKLLLDRGADASIRVKEIYTPLNYAVLNGHQEAAELLLPAISRNDAIARARCPGCGSKQEILIGIPLFVSDRQSRRILRCIACGAIWSKRKVEWRGSLYGMFIALIVAFYCFEASRDRHGFAYFRIAIVALWIWIGIKEFSKYSKPSRIWVHGAIVGSR
jgi:ankyrin repeat protein